MDARSLGVVAGGFFAVGTIGDLHQRRAAPEIDSGRNAPGRVASSTGESHEGCQYLCHHTVVIHVAWPPLWQRLAATITVTT